LKEEIMQQQDIIYNKAKESLRTYGRIDKKSINEKVIYECAAIIYSIRQDYKEDTRCYNVTQSIYEIEKEMIYRLHKKISQNEECKEEAAEACKDALTYIELVVRPRINLSSLAC
jgi:hypothetical protein